MEQKNGSGIIGVHAFEQETGLFLVMPTEHINLKEGFYSFTFSKNLYTNFNPQLLINSHSHITHEKMEELTGYEIKGMGIDGNMTSPIWGYKEHSSGLFY